MSVVSDGGGGEPKGGEGVGEGGKIAAGGFQELDRERYWLIGRGKGGGES